MKAYYQYLNTPVGCIETPHVSYLYDSQPLPNAPNSNSIAEVVDNAVRALRINRNSYCLLWSNAAKYIVALGAILRSLHPKLFCVTCVA